MSTYISNAIEYAFNNNVSNMQSEIENALKTKISATLEIAKNDIAQNLLNQNEELEEGIIDVHKFDEPLKKLGGRVGHDSDTGVLFTFNDPFGARNFHKALSTKGLKAELYGTNVHLPNNLKEELNIENLEEISQEALSNYKKKAIENYDKNVKASHTDNYKHDYDSMEKHVDKSIKRSKGILKANDKMMSKSCCEDNIEEEGMDNPIVKTSVAIKDRFRDKLSIPKPKTNGAIITKPVMPKITTPKVYINVARKIHDL